MPSKKSVTATRFCKICHRKIEQNSLYELIFTAKSICLRCFYNLKPNYVHFKDHGTKVLVLYPYEQNFQSLLFQYKGCGDIELSGTFLERVSPLLKLRYRGYVLVPAPSHVSHVEKRGFDHVPLIFQGLGKGVVPLLEKTADRKQSSQNKTERTKIAAYLKLNRRADLRGKKLLFVDDVYTTGSTLRACVKLLWALHPKTVEALVLARVPKKEKEVEEADMP